MHAHRWSGLKGEAVIEPERSFDNETHHDRMDGGAAVDTDSIQDTIRSRYIQREVDIFLYSLVECSLAAGLGSKRWGKPLSVRSIGPRS